MRRWPQGPARRDAAEPAAGTGLAVARSVGAGQLGERGRDLGEQLAGEETERADAARQPIAGAAVEVNAPDRGLERRRAPRGEAGDDARQGVAGAGRGEADVARAVAVRFAARRRDVRDGA